MKRAIALLSLAFSLLLFTLVIFPIRAATALQAAPTLTPTIKACHICDEGLPQPVVHAILFWMNGCPHCHEVLDNVLPPLQERYGAQLEILLVEVVGKDDVNRLYDIAATYGIPRDQVGVPFLILGDQVLVGSQQIPEELPGLIERYLAQGGIDRPSISNLNDFLVQTTPTPLSIPALNEANVRAILFTTLDCRTCQLEVGAALGPVQEKYGEQFEMRTVDILTAQDVEYLHQVAESYGISRQEVDLPLIIIGEQVLIGEQVAAELPDLVASYLAMGGVDWPSIPARPEAVLPANTGTNASATVYSNGFWLAIVIMALMAVALIYSLIAFWLGKAIPLPAWADWLIPALIFVGIGVAGYLSYVETQSVEAICGPVGDCNAVQQSRYAKLFDILPVGILGLLGYIALLAAWLVRRFLPRLEKLAALSFWGLAFFAVIFSLYLTYLEPFVIKAVCIWCLTSAVIVTLLLLLGTPPAVLHFAISDEDE
jgi:uncharacterized membrane protein